MGEAGWSEELCPECLLRLALEESSEVSGEPETFTGTSAPMRGSRELSRGQILGGRYGLRHFLGHGGMGEVWQAFDLKLRVDVALKTVRRDLASVPRVLETLRQEVRAAREVVSPNVCRVHDLQELGGRELVSMEYVDGTTLLAVLEERGPLELQEAREIASQLLAGLDAIHQAGLVHRDIKPENVMITRTGRVVVMDFGIAKGLSAGGTGTVAGTPAYMAPEQERGEGVDARADVFSAGVVLAEMLAPECVAERSAREALWRGIRQQPPQLPDSPWREVLEVAVSARPEHRFASAAALARALEEVAIRVEGAEDVRPYPGLQSFGEESRDYFFGRELESEALWKKIRRLHLLALVGPSGAGKTSFLRAGLLGNEPAGWSHVICTPGEAPLTALRQALVPHALVVVDQFEELFTLNPLDVQASFADLLGRLAVEADLHVLLSLRDDFLIRCNAHEALTPILSELTLLGPPTGAALRRAIVQPALKCGYRFEDEALVERMLSEVEGERGALPLVAFAAEQLWERRDKTQGLLTREAYEVIGGVGGALAQHAELTLERIGTGRAPIVRELFRNLVTGEGTRAVRERAELLSVFPEGRERDTAAEVLDVLVDARLLTGYGAEAAEGQENGQRVEIVHESLLTAWPRLVRWQAQDVEGAKLRDDLRQAARRWQERDRPEDLLWTGSAYRELQLWRERYPGSLSEIEDAFAKAVADHAERTRRRRRMWGGAVVAALLLVAGATTALWRQAVAEARRADASQLLTRAQLALDTDPTRAVAWATKSLELADTRETRRFVLGALQRGPTARILTVLGEEEHTTTLYAFILRFHPEGSWLAMLGNTGVQVWPQGGGEPRVFDGYPWVGGYVCAAFSPAGDILATVQSRLDLWSLPDGRNLASHEFAEGSRFCLESGERFVTFREGDDLTLESWPFDGGPPRGIDPAGVSGRWIGDWDIDPRGELLAWHNGRDVFVRPLDDPDAPARRVATQADETVAAAFGPDGQRIAVRDTRNRVRIWPTEPETPTLLHTVDVTGTAGLAQDHAGTRLATLSIVDGHPRARLWDLDGPPDAEPLELRRSQEGGPYFSHLVFDPGGQWLVTAHVLDVAFWPLARPYPRILARDAGSPFGVAFTPDGRELIAVSLDGTVRAWPLSGEAGEGTRVLFTAPAELLGVAISPAGDRYLAGGVGGRVFVGSLTGGEPLDLEGFSSTTQIRTVAFDPTGRRAAAAGSRGQAEEKVVRIWDLETGAVRVLGPAEGAVEGYEGGYSGLHFTPDGTRILTSADSLRLWNLADDTAELLDGGVTGPSALSPDGRRVVYSRRVDPVSFFGATAVAGSEYQTELVVLDLETRESRVVGSQLNNVTFDRDGTRFVASGADSDQRGEIAVGSLEGGAEPHLLLGHESGVRSLAVSPDGRWIASTSADGTVRLWPMPEGRPLHSLPHDELIAKLHTLTNLRVVEDEEASGGYAMTVGPFPGWEDLPTW